MRLSDLPAETGRTVRRVTPTTKKTPTGRPASPPSACAAHVIASVNDVAITKGSTVNKVWGREPALVLALVNAALMLGVGFQLPVTGEQVALVNAFVAALIGFVTRSQVTPYTNQPDVR